MEPLALKEELEATGEIKSDGEIKQQINEARRTRLQGKSEEYIPWEMRRSVKN